MRFNICSDRQKQLPQVRQIQSKRYSFSEITNLRKADILDPPRFLEALPSRPAFRVRAETFPVLRQVTALSFQRATLPVALRTVCASR